ncbi:Para-aminobenzoate synthase, partial [Leucoagaricus sp. SymC.cos]
SLVYLLIENIPGCSVYLIQNDGMTIETLTPLLKYFDVSVVSSGPGSPEIESDTGLIKNIWRLDDDHVMPVCSVCFGLQSLGFHFNARLHRMKVVKYHSLHVTLDSASFQLRRIGWAFYKEDNGEIFMAIERARLPLWTFQYHPESTGATGGSVSIVANFWKLPSFWVVSSDVQVKKFWVDEEYETVFQLVSVTEARASEVLDFEWGALRKCLPPGSMTGAPKKHSVEILQFLEIDERGVYSGVHGYCANCSKWLYAKRDCAVLYIPERNQGIIHAAVPPSLPYLPATEDEETSAFVDQFYWSGSFEIASLLSAPAALEFRKSIGGDACIADYCQSLASRGAFLLQQELVGSCECASKRGKSFFVGVILRPSLSV